jgi:hypothetical protein
MTKFKIICLASIAIAGVVASLMVQHKSQVKFRERDALVRQQGQQLAALKAEHQRLSNLAARAKSAPADDHKAELARLRREAEALKQQTNDLGRPLARSQASRSSPPASSPQSHTPEYYEQLHQMSGGKMKDAMNLAKAFISYASDHQNQFPSSLDQMAPYQAKAGMPFSGANQFEIVCQGSFEKLQGIPPGTVAVVREQQAWAGPDGRMMRIYGLADGSAQIVGSDDNFQSWEAQHIILPRKAGQ